MTKRAEHLKLVIHVVPVMVVKVVVAESLHYVFCCCGYELFTVMSSMV